MPFAVKGAVVIMSEKKTSGIKKFFDEFKAFAMRGNVLDMAVGVVVGSAFTCLLYTSPSPRDGLLSRMPSSA